MIALRIVTLFMLIGCAAATVLQFEPCTAPQDAEYNTYELGSALIELNSGSVGGTFNWNFCAQTQAALMHVKTARIQLYDKTNTTVVSTHDVAICNTARTDCLAQLRTKSYPSCIHGKRSLDWLSAPTDDGLAKIQLIEPGNNNKVIAEYCS